MFSLLLLVAVLLGDTQGAPNHLKVYVSKEVGESAVQPGNAASSFASANAAAVAQAGAGGNKPDNVAGSAHFSANFDATSGGSADGNSGSTFFDNIFNIPISVLKSVNTHLNNKDHAGHPPRLSRKCRRRGICSVQELQGAHVSTSVGSSGQPGPASGTATASAGSFATASASASASSQGGSVAPGPSFDSGASAGSIEVRKNYDQIFNIPITALKSVNQLLNG